jgi:hypothetical protein
MKISSLKPALVLASTFGVLGALPAFAADVDTQRQAIFACKNAAGVGGEASLSTTLGADPVVRIEVYDQVTQENADQINDCAARAVGRSTTTVNAAPVPVTNQSYKGGKYGKSSGRSGYRYGNVTCPPHFYGMYRGNLFCFYKG